MTELVAAEGYPTKEIALGDGPTFQDLVSKMNLIALILNASARLTFCNHLFRLAPEAVTNALKHAEATLIQVRLDIQAGLVRLTVVDDGIGLPLQPIISDRL